MVLVCNDPAAAEEVFGGLGHAMPPASLARLALMHGRVRAPGMDELQKDRRYTAALSSISALLAPAGELPLA